MFKSINFPPPHQTYGNVQVVKMPIRTSAIQKKVAKKRKAIHENSRDAQRLRTAGLRDEKLARLAATRAKGYQPLLQRTAFFRDAAQKMDGSLAGVMDELINGFIHRDDEELADLKRQRRPGRPSSTKEDLLRRRLADEEQEYSTGFYMPDLEDAENIDRLKSWNGDWAALGSIKFVRIRQDGDRRESVFPPKGGA